MSEATSLREELSTELIFDLVRGCSFGTANIIYVVVFFFFVFFFRFTLAASFFFFFFVFFFLRLVGKGRGARSPQSGKS